MTTEPFPAPKCPECGEELQVLFIPMDPTAEGYSPVTATWECRNPACPSYAQEKAPA